MIERYWKITRDPFTSSGEPAHVVLPSQIEAEERLTRAIVSGERTVVLEGSAGLGKSVVLARVLARVRSPRRRVARAVGPIDGLSLHTELAESLGARNVRGLDRAQAWRTLLEAVRLCRWQGSAVVLAVDDHQMLEESRDRLDLRRLSRIDPHPAARMTLVLVGRAGEADDRHFVDEQPNDWSPPVRIAPVTRGEAVVYLNAKLAAAGRTEPTFTPKAMTLIHGIARGVPREIDQLSSSALRLAAARKHEMVSPEVVEAVAIESVDAA